MPATCSKNRWPWQLAEYVPSSRSMRRMPALRGIDVIQLVDDRVELRHPRLGARIETLFARPVERLIAEARQRERDHVLDPAPADRHDRRLGDEPLRAARDAPLDRSRQK